MIEADQGRCADAVRNLRRYLELRKIDVEGNGTGKPPDDHALEAAARIDKCEGRGAVLVQSQPLGAEVRFDDGAASVGVTPLLRRRLAAGMHRLELSKPGHKREVVTVSVRAGETVVVTVGLRADMVAQPAHAVTAPGPQAVRVEARKQAAPVPPQLPTVAARDKPLAQRRSAVGDEDEFDLPKSLPKPAPVGPAARPAALSSPAVAFSAAVIPPADEEKPLPRRWYQKAWVWGVVAAGSAVVAGSVAATVYLTARDPLAPSDLRISAGTLRSGLEVGQW